eukprot:scaffold67089_cov34-Tisochrysis_lutea.AAC.5
MTLGSAFTSQAREVRNIACLVCTTVGAHNALNARLLDSHCSRRKCLSSPTMSPHCPSARSCVVHGLTCTGHRPPSTVATEGLPETLA